MKRLSILLFFFVLMACGGSPHVTQPLDEKVNQKVDSGGNNQTPDNPDNPQDPGGDDPNEPLPPNSPPDICAENVDKYPDITDHKHFYENNFYHIYNLRQLRSLGADKSAWNLNYKLMANIDLTMFYIKNPGKFFSIGSSRNPYSGTFDGNNCIIKGFQFIEKKKLLGLLKFQKGGLFSRTNKAHIKNLRMVESIVVGDHIGVVSSYAINTVFEKIYLTGSSSSRGKSGMLAGKVKDSIIRQVAVRDFLVKGKKFVGGIVGEAFNSTLIQVYTHHGEVVGDKEVGGIVGKAKKSKLIQAYAFSWVQAKKKDGGGIAGHAIETNFNNLNTLSDVNAKKGIHRFVGKKKKSHFSGLFYWEGLNCPDCTLGLGTGVESKTHFYNGDHDMYKEWDKTIWAFSENEMPRLMWE